VKPPRVRLVSAPGAFTPRFVRFGRPRLSLEARCPRLISLSERTMSG
jgi:hypothetical protein